MAYGHELYHAQCACQYIRKQPMEEAESPCHRLIENKWFDPKGIIAGELECRI